MNNSYLSKIGFGKLNEIVFSAKKGIYFSYPSIHPEIADLFQSILERNNELDIKVVIDQSEKKIRNGYGNIDAINKLIDLGVELYHVDNNLISFIIVDDIGYYLFPESRLFEEDGKSLNAVKLTKLDILKIIKHFFSNETLTDEEIANVTADTHQELKEDLEKLNSNKRELLVKNIDKEKLEETRKNIERDPVKSPDLERQIKVYKAKIQYLELNFSGVNFNVRKIDIPVETLPINDENLRRILETKVKLFENIQVDSALWELKWIKRKVDLLRKKYTKPLSNRKKRVVYVNAKNELQEEIKKLVKKVDELKEKSEELFKVEIEKGKNSLSNTLKDYLKIAENRPSHLKPEQINDYVEYVLDQIEFPSPAEFKDQIALNYHFYDFTWEDLQSEEILKELKSKGIIEKEDYDEIVRIRDAFETEK